VYAEISSGVENLWKCGGLGVRTDRVNIWELVKQSLALRLSPEGYRNWIAETRMLGATENSLRVAVPNEATKAWLEEEYAELVFSTIRDLNLGVNYVIEYVPITAAADNVSRVMATEPSENQIFSQSTNGRLNPKFTFDTFVVGSCNQFAHAAAKAVASAPSRSYNPLFIYGGVGMGKTHLMHAIGSHLLSNFSAMNIIYTSSERFMNEMIHCISTQRMAQFHNYYRSADVLLVDDIHILAGKERTQEEFFHTFNALHEHQKQIVISSDSTPKDIPGLVERLRSRFEWGLMVDIQPPDLETKMAILDRKADMEGVKLPEDVRVFIATKTKSNIRELEGALVRLVAYSSMTGLPINMATAQHCLRHLINGSERKTPRIDSVIRAVAEKFGLQPAQLKQKTNARAIAYPRQIAMYLTKELTGASLPEIGRAFGGKHHTTVLHSVQKIEQMRHSDPDLNRMIHSISDSIN
jgi:chromosomal replication initiator protein